MTEENSVSRSWVCWECGGEIFDSERQLWDHFIEEHDTRPAPMIRPTEDERDG